MVAIVVDMVVVVVLALGEERCRTARPVPRLTKIK